MFEGWRALAQLARLALVEEAAAGETATLPLDGERRRRSWTWVWGVVTVAAVGAVIAAMGWMGWREATQEELRLEAVTTVRSPVPVAVPVPVTETEAVTEAVTETGAEAVTETGAEAVKPVAVVQKVRVPARMRVEGISGNISPKAVETALGAHRLRIEECRARAQRKGPVHFLRALIIFDEGGRARDVALSTSAPEVMRNCVRSTLVHVRLPESRAGRASFTLTFTR